MVEFENEEILLKALKSGKPITFFTGHYCNWELGILAIGAKYLPLSIVGRPLDFGWANKILGSKLREAGFGGKSVISQKRGALKEALF